MKTFIDQATPFALAMFLSMIGVVAVWISEAPKIVSEADLGKRAEKAKFVFLAAVAPNLCLGAFSFDIWAITTLFSADKTSVAFYNLSGKSNLAQIILLVHVILYLAIIGWGGVVRGRGEETKALRLEAALGIAAAGLCIVFQGMPS